MHSTLARSSIIVKGKAWVARTGVGTRHIGTQLLAVAVTALIYIYEWERRKAEWSAFPHANTKHQTHWINGTNNREVTQRGGYRSNSQTFRCSDWIIVKMNFCLKECSTAFFSTSDIWQQILWNNCHCCNVELNAMSSEGPESAPIGITWKSTWQLVLPINTSTDSPAAKLCQNQGRRTFYFHVYQSYSQKKQVFLTKHSFFYSRQDVLWRIVFQQSHLHFIWIFMREITRSKM